MLDLDEEKEQDAEIDQTEIEMAQRKISLEDIDEEEEETDDDIVHIGSQGEVNKAFKSEDCIMGDRYSNTL